MALPKGQTLRELFEERAALYEAYADIIVDEDGLDVEGTIEKIVEQLKIAHDF